jgi:hypothetical protein
MEEKKKSISFSRMGEERKCYVNQGGKTLGQFLKAIGHEKDPKLRYTVNAHEKDNDYVLSEGDFVIAIPKVKGGSR